MLNQNKNKQTVRGEFFWLIPGDVPGYRDQPDPYQSFRSIPDADYQHPPHLDIQQSQQTPTSETLTMQSVAGANATDLGQTRVNKFFKSVAIFILLLFMPGIGVVGSNHSVTHPGADLGQASGKLAPIAVAQANPVQEPKIYNLTLGKQVQTPQSMLRVVTHVVVKGDTLWDISEVYVKNPFRYPELAELSNIKDPDLIYPYDLVRIHIYE